MSKSPRTWAWSIVPGGSSLVCCLPCWVGNRLYARLNGMRLWERVVVAISLGVSVVVIGFFIYRHSFYQKPLPSNRQGLGELHREAMSLAQAKHFKTLKLKQMTTNLYSARTRLRYLNMEVHLSPFKEEQIAELQRSQSFIYDAILTIAGKKRPAEINSLSGKLLFEHEIKQRINRELSRPLVRQIFFAAFVIQ